MGGDGAVGVGGGEHSEAPAEGSARASQHTCVGPIAQVEESVQGIRRLYKLIFFIKSMNKNYGLGDITKP